MEQDIRERASRLPPGEARELKEAWAAFKDPSTPEREFALSDAPTLIPIELSHGLAEARITRFHSSRRYYKLLREGRSTISAYVSQSLHSLEMVSITLATGMELERVIDTFEDLIVRKEPVAVTVSVLDPDLDHLMRSISGVIGASPMSLSGRIQDTLETLADFAQDRLSSKNRDLFQVRAHACLPNASVIMIDADHNNGLVQLETKGYKMGMEKSFGFEVGSGSESFDDLRESYRHLIRDGRRIL